MTNSASKMWQHEVQDFNMAGCTDNTCNEANNCDGGADGLKPFGCGHFTQQIWAVSILYFLSILIVYNIVTILIYRL